MIRIKAALPLSLLGSLALLAACSSDADNLAALDNDLLANGADPALTSALEDQILVDPDLVQQAHPNSVRPPEAPVQAQYPADGPGSAAEARLKSAAISGGDQPSACGRPFVFANGWANRLPAEFPLYPGSQVTEAAGADSANCHARVVTFRTADDGNRVLNHYRNLAARAGYSAEPQRRGADLVLAGVNPGHDGAFFLIVTPQPQGSEVALIVNKGS